MARCYKKADPVALAALLDEVRLVVRYNQETGEFLDSIGRRIDRASHKGYYRVRVFGARYYAHRLAWLIVRGEWPHCELDHINGNPSDNRFCNLRIATRQQNCQNVVKQPGICGLYGVTKQKHTKKFRAKITVNCRSKHLGYYDTKEQAHEVAVRAVDKHRGEFSPFQRKRFVNDSFA